MGCHCFNFPVSGLPICCSQRPGGTDIIIRGRGMFGRRDRKNDSRAWPAIFASYRANVARYESARVEGGELLN
jgi:hypothetical protein